MCLVVDVGIIPVLIFMTLLFRGRSDEGKANNACWNLLGQLVTVGILVGLNIFVYFQEIDAWTWY
jgi:hypothetical protein